MDIRLLKGLSGDLFYYLHNTIENFSKKLNYNLV
nr:MAG TPA_asm: hypothetical protein [Caudoviricetes sp.]